MKHLLKQFACLILSVLLLVQPLAVSAAEQQPQSTKIKIPKFLLIGNSYSLDIATYLGNLLDTDEDVEEYLYGYLYYPGCSLSMHVKYGQNNSPVYDYYKRDSSTGKTVKKADTTLEYALKDEDWEIIYLQQAPLHSAQKDKFTGHLDNLISYVKKTRTNPDAKFGWHMTWSYAPDYVNKGFTYSKPFAEEFQGDPLLMYNAIADIVQNTVMKKKDFVSMIPAGTAIQNARTSYFGDTMNRDTYHLSDLGKAITGYTWYSCLTGKTIESVNLTGVALNDMDRVLVKEAANNAVANPYAVTPSLHPERLDPRTLNLTCATASVGGQTVTTAVKDTEVTLTYTVPNKDFVFEEWKVVSGNVTLADPKNPVTTFTMPNEDVTIEGTYINKCPSQNMKDISPFQWYHEAVDYVLNNGIMGGYNAEQFGPNDSLSRAMVVQVLYNKEGKPAVTAENKFPDVPAGQWYVDAVRWAADKGVVGGYGDGRFGPDDNVTIEQVAVILHNYSGKPAAEGGLSGVGKYDDWAAGALQWAVANGILNTVPFTDATETATRAQTAQMLMNYMNR